jgi:hypothetical protein
MANIIALTQDEFRVQHPEQFEELNQQLASCFAPSQIPGWAWEDVRYGTIDDVPWTWWQDRNDPVNAGPDAVTIFEPGIDPWDDDRPELVNDFVCEICDM